MRCEEARLALGPELGPRAANPTSTDAFAHVQQCAACERFFVAQRKLIQRLRPLGTVPAPRALRDRVQRAIARDAAVPRSRRRRRVWLAGAGVSVAAAAVLVALLSAPRIPDRVAQPLVAHASQATLAGSGLATTTSDPRQLHRWFEARLGYAVSVPQIDDAELTGGRVVDLGGQQVAAVIYMYHNHAVTYFPLTSGDVLGSPVDWDSILTHSADGYELALWQERGRARVAVAAMSRGDLVKFAEECRAKALGVT